MIFKIAAGRLKFQLGQWSRLCFFWGLLCGAGFVAAGPAHGQTLSLARQNGSQYGLDCRAPAGEHFVLQASANLNLWVDIHDPVAGAWSAQFDRAGVDMRYFRLIPYQETPEAYLVMLGDSTVMDGSGWGRSIYGYLKSNLTAVNLAWPDCSSLVYLSSEQRSKVKVIRPNFVLIQFGYADTSLTVGTTLPQFKTNLLTVVQEVRGFGGVPILVTPMVQRLFDEQGKVQLLFQERYAIIKEVAREQQTPCIDLNQLSRDYLNSLGESGSTDLYWNDNVHLMDKGAQVISKMVVNACPASMGPYLRGIFDDLPKP